MPDYGIYYVHVIDDQGFIAHSSLKYEVFNFDTNKSLADNLIKSKWLWQSGLEGDGYRYVGTNPDNYVCFGTRSVSDCTANQDKYMYRIIGVFPDSSNNQHVKLIKYKQLGKYAWDSNIDTLVTWPNSSLYKGLNGSYYLTNTTYNYLSDSTWNSFISNWTWTNLYINPGVSSLLVNYSTGLSPKQIYLHEMNRSSNTFTSQSSWTTSTGKIGIMYASDYVLSLGDSVLSLTSSTTTNKALLKTGWMHQSNNDTSKSTSEITMSLVSDEEYYLAWSISATGEISRTVANVSTGIRPTFYLINSARAISGNGSISNPFLITTDDPDADEN